MEIKFKINPTNTKTLRQVKVHEVFMVINPLMTETNMHLMLSLPVQEKVVLDLTTMKLWNPYDLDPDVEVIGTIKL